MDKRLELTEKQREIVERYDAIVKEMIDAKIGCLHKEYAELYVYNKENVKHWGFSEDSFGDEDIEVPLKDLKSVECPYEMCLTWQEDNSIKVDFF